jgi:hypothetical protein
MTAPQKRAGAGFPHGSRLPADLFSSRQPTLQRLRAVADQRMVLPAKLGVPGDFLQRQRTVVHGQLV